MPTRADDAASKLRAEGLDVVAQAHDVNDPQSAEDLASFVESEYGEVHVLVNNAAAIFDVEEGDSTSILATSKEALTRSFETNTIGAVLTAQALVPLMKKTGYGRIVNVSSGMGGITEMNGGYPGYRLSKAALNASTRVLFEELKDDNIKVNALCPGWVRTDMGGENAHLSPRRRGRHNRVPLNSPRRRPHGYLLPQARTDSLVEIQTGRSRSQTDWTKDLA